MPSKITAEIRAYSKESFPSGYIYWGDIYGDTKERHTHSGDYPSGWPDGRQMRTSAVQSEVDMGDHILVNTLNSVYKLMKDQSLEALIKKDKNNGAGETGTSEASV